MRWPGAVPPCLKDLMCVHLTSCMRTLAVLVSLCASNAYVPLTFLMCI